MRRFDDATADGSDGGGMPWGRADWIAVGALFLVSFVLVGLHIRAYPTLSPIDELAHVDYVLKAGDLDPPGRADRIGQAAMAEAACRTLDVEDYRGPPCGLDEYSPDDFGERVFRTNAINTAAGQFPAYYTITGLLSRGAAAVGIVESQVTAARFVGALWAGAGWSMIWAVLGLLRIPRVNRAWTIALLIATPLTLFHAATVNADAVLLFTGATVVYASIRFARAELRWWWLLATYVVLTLLEPTTALAVGVSSAFLAVRVTLRPDRSAWDRAIPVVAVLLAGVQRFRFARWARDVVVAGPTGPAPGPQSASASGGPMPLGAPSGGSLPAQAAEPEVSVEVGRLVEQLTAIFSPVDRAYVPPFWRSELTIQLIQLTDWLLVAGMFAAAGALVVRRSTTAGLDTLWLSRVGLVGALLAGPFYTFSYAYFGNDDFNAPGRFGLPLLVVFAIALSSVLVTRWARGMVAAVATLTVLNTTWYLLTA